MVNDRQFYLYNYLSLRTLLLTGEPKL